ncbi:MAG: TlpA family protein disulfide reductase [Cloacibacterium caeni]
MKKLIFSTLILTALFSCKKNEAPNQLTEETTTETVDSAAVTPANALPEVNQEQLKAMVAPQKNDTIYVTNFFATWCGPCVKEIPHFKEKMEELKGKPVKFTFVSVDAKEDWNTAVSDFADEYDIRKNVVLFDASMIAPDYFTTITKTWDGSSIPFTVIKKGDKEIETVGMMSKEDLDAKLNSFK